MTSEHDAAREVGVARMSEEAGQRPRSKGAAQGKLLDEGTTAVPETDEPVSPRLAELVARARKEERLTNAVQFVDEELLRQAFGSLRKRAAPGVDGQSYEDYAANLDANLRDVYERLRTGRYRAPVVRRVYIPKAKGGRRPIGITTVEDRMVQKAVAWVLSAVFEQDFLECSHGFRPQRSTHTALHRLREGMMQHWAKYVVEVDVASYFDSVGFDWAKAPGSSGSARRAASPEASSSDGCAEATTGTPLAIASMIGIPNPSKREGYAKTAAPR